MPCISRVSAGPKSPTAATSPGRSLAQSAPGGQERSDEWAASRGEGVTSSSTRASNLARLTIPPGRYFRMHLVGYFEGIDSERGLEWRCADSLSLREFLRLGTTEPVGPLLAQ